MARWGLSLLRTKLLLHRRRRRRFALVLCPLVIGKALIVGSELLELALVHFLKVEEDVPCLPRHADQLVDLDMHRRGIAVLRVLDHEHHEEGDNRGRGVDDQLPGIAESKKGPGDAPNDERRDGEDKCDRMTSEARRQLGKPREPTSFSNHCLVSCKRASWRLRSCLDG